jgi:hydroxypyruvate isomerase
MVGPLHCDVNCSILFTGLPLLERPAAARAAGFGAVEFWWPFPQAVPSDADCEAFIRSVRAAGVALASLNFFAGDMAAGERGLLSLPGRAAEFRDNIDATLGIGERLGCRVFNALYGNRIDGVAAGRQDEIATESLAMAAHAAAEIGGTVMLEPLSGPQPYPLRTAADVSAVVARVRREAAVSNVAMLADLYHLHVNGEDLARVIEDHAGRIAHVQIADDPGRHEPGTGVIDFDGVLAQLQRTGYAGSVGLEYIASEPQSPHFGWLQARKGLLSGYTAPDNGGRL